MTCREASVLSNSNVVSALSIQECQKLDRSLRADLELVDYEIRSIVTRILTDVDRSGVDSVLFLKASTTVLLSIAAGLLTTAADEANGTFDVATFMSGAEDAAEWARTCRLKYCLGGEA
jgi:hypothetical protein